MKRIATFILVLASVFMFLVGCASSDSGSSSESSKKDTLIIGIDDTFAPLGFRDEKNEIVGFDIDMAKAAAEKMGVEVEISQSTGPRKKLS